MRIPHFLPLLLVASATAFSQGTKADYERAQSLDKRTNGKVFRAKVSPHWLPGGNALWYRIESAPGTREVVYVDALKGTRSVVADVSKIPGAVAGERMEDELEPHPSRNGGDETSITFINKTAGTVRLFWLDTSGARKPYGEVKAGASNHMSTYAGHVWLVEDEMGKTLGVFEAKDAGGEAVIDGARPERKAPEAKPAPARSEAPKGDRTWRGFIRDFNVWAKNRDTGEEVQLSRDGTAADAYREPLRLSPDGTKLVVMRVQPAQEHKVWLVESSPADQVQPKLLSYDYLKPGDRIEHARPCLFDLGQRRQIVVKDDLFSNPWHIGELRWMPDGKRFVFVYNQRGHQVLRVVAVDATTGEARALVDETSKTFIDYSQKTFLHWLDRTNELVWASERDGWNHLWLYDARSGQVKNQITHGVWLVREVVRVDEERRQIWFKAMGIRQGQDPYHVHLARVNFDGSGLVVLTEGDGTHTWEFSPDGRLFIDTWSRVDQPPVTELRRTDDGKLVCALEKADAGALVAAGWKMPERFAAKGRDGKTDIFGVIYRPSNFDAARKYPVIEKIYAGPHDYFTPKQWGREIQAHALAELGFIVVQIDGMGTNWRSRAFHDACWKNVADAGFPDRIAWMKAAAATHPEMDIARVGIFGGSAGGQSALGALLFHGDFYKAAAADCGCHDNRMDKIWWNEAWMGWPVGPEYAANSNVVNAKNLTGKLLLTVGELDHNVDPASTMQVVNALVKADKDFELLIVPGRDHGAGETPYAARRRLDFFVRNLLGVEPRR
jgi:dipeptidyl aminopeptidase/acylaminoacyl peptidase